MKNVIVFMQYRNIFHTENDRFRVELKLHINFQKVALLTVVKVTEEEDWSMV